MSIKVLKAGMQTTIQDAGRQGYMHLGVPACGAMDSLSMKLANYLVCKPYTAPVLEVCLIGPTLQFSQALTIAITGAQFELSLIHEGEKRALSNNTSIQISAGDILYFGRRLQGARAYIAFAADLAIEKVLSSYSTCLLAAFGGLNGQALKNNDTVALHNLQVVTPREIPKSLRASYGGNYLLRCVPSVETAYFSQAQQQAFYQQTYTLSSMSNRMGLRFEGEALEMSSMLELTSSGLTQGSVQIPPSGLPIVSSVDGQTIGGYPRIANVIGADLFALGQLVAGDKVNFTLISIAEAHEILLKHQQRELALLA